VPGPRHLLSNAGSRSGRGSTRAFDFRAKYASTPSNRGVARPRAARSERHNASGFQRLCARGGQAELGERLPRSAPFHIAKTC